MKTYEEFVTEGVIKAKYEQLGGVNHDISTDESDMYKALLMENRNQCEDGKSIGIITILRSGL